MKEFRFKVDAPNCKGYTHWMECSIYTTDVLEQMANDFTLVYGPYWQIEYR